MLLLLVMYLAPFVAIVLYWRAQSVGAVAHANAGAAPSEDLENAGAWQTLRATAQPRLALVKPAAAAFAFVTVVAGFATGLSGALAFAIGALLSAFAAALVHALSRLAALRGSTRPCDAMSSPQLKGVWSDAFATALALAALAAGSLGALAWFFADPAGAPVLVVLAAGGASGALFIGMTVGMPAAVPDSESADERASRLARSESAWGTAAAIQVHMAAAAAAIIVAATADPESLLPLGGLLSETETLRSELLLLPIAITVLSPIVAVMAGPVMNVLLERRGEAALFDAERLAASIGGLLLLSVVTLSGLSLTVAWTFAIGLVARQVAVLVDEATHRGGGAGRAGIQASSVVPALIAAAAFIAGDQLAGWYGTALVALGMTATFVSAATAAAARRMVAFVTTPSATVPDSTVADTAATLTAALALLAALAPVVVADRMHRELVAMLATNAEPVLLVAVVVGAACASSLSARSGDSSDEADSVRSASQAVASAAAIPLLVGLAFGAAAAVGVTLGFTAWAAAWRAPQGAALTASSVGQRPVLLAWARAMALSTLVCAPLMN